MCSVSFGAWLTPRNLEKAVGDLGSLQEISAAKVLKIGAGIWMDFGWIWGPKISKNHGKIAGFWRHITMFSWPKKSLRRLNCLNSCQWLRRKKWKVRVEWAQNKQEGVSIYCWTCSLKCGQINWPWNMCDCIMGVLNEYLQGTAFLLTSFEGPYFGFTPTRRRGFFFQLGC